MGPPPGQKWAVARSGLRCDGGDGPARANSSPGPHVPSAMALFADDTKNFHGCARGTKKTQRQARAGARQEGCATAEGGAHVRFCNCAFNGQISPFSQNMPDSYPVTSAGRHMHQADLPSRTARSASQAFTTLGGGQGRCVPPSQGAVQWRPKQEDDGGRGTRLRAEGKTRGGAEGRARGALSRFERVASGA